MYKTINSGVQYSGIVPRRSVSHTTPATSRGILMNTLPADPSYEDFQSAIYLLPPASHLKSQIFSLPRVVYTTEQEDVKLYYDSTLKVILSIQEYLTSSNISC